MLAQCDFVVPAIPATSQVTGMFSTKEFKVMKDSAYFINIARAELLDEQSTYDALKEGTIAGAALDVWWDEDEYHAGPAFRNIKHLLNVNKPEQIAP